MFNKNYAIDASLILCETEIKLFTIFRVKVKEMTMFLFVI
jgi:hypothetical protein